MWSNRLYKITAAAALYTNLAATPNFDLINAEPQIPIHVSTNGGPWQTLDQQHYRFPINVPENSLLVMSLSANDDKSTPTNLIFAPERALDTAKQVGSKITKAPTFYVQAKVVVEKVPGSDNIIKHVQLTPQASLATGNKTKSGLSLENNVTQEMIDAIVGISASDSEEPEQQDEAEPITTAKPVTEQNEPATANAMQQPKSPVADETQKPAQKQPEPAKTEPTAIIPAPSWGPTALTTPLQHTDTPQMVLATLKKIIKQKKSADTHAQWVEVRDYITSQQAKELFKDHDDAYIFNLVIEHYQELAEKTKSNLKKVYTHIIEIIKKAYKTAYP